MKKIERSWLLPLILMGAIILLWNGCKKEETASFALTSIERITDNSATCACEITSDGNSTVTASGVCWSTSVWPTIADNITTDGKGSGKYNCQITGLSPNQLYHVRAYATNSQGTSYGEAVYFTTNPTVTDKDGNVYHTIYIGTRIWMSENLRVTHYRNGEAIAKITGDQEWIAATTGAYCEYQHSNANSQVYGYLYNAFAVMDDRGLAPEGWHVATDEEWKFLEGCIDSQYHLDDPEWDKTLYRGLDAGGNLKAVSDYWSDPNTGATDASGFSALPGGYRETTQAVFYGIHVKASFWTSTRGSQMNTWAREVNHDNAGILRSTYTNGLGASVRCIRAL